MTFLAAWNLCTDFFFHCKIYVFQKIFLINKTFKNCSLEMQPILAILFYKIGLKINFTTFASLNMSKRHDTARQKCIQNFYFICFIWRHLKDVSVSIEVFKLAYLCSKTCIKSVGRSLADLCYKNRFRTYFKE